MKKTLVVAAILFPPSLIGPAVLMGNLFRRFPKNSFHVLMGHLDHIWCRKDMESRLDCCYHFSRYPFCNYNGNLFNRIRSVLRDIAALFEIFWKGIRIIRKEQIDSIFVIADHYVELGALLMRWMTGKKVVLWLPDLYYVPDSSKTDWTQVAERVIEPFLLKAVDTVLVTGEPTQEYYQERYGLNTVVMPHSVEFGKYTSLTQQVSKGEKFTDILFTGSVTLAQHGALLDMVRIVNEFPELDAKLIIVSNELTHKVEEMGIRGPRVVCKQVKREEIPALQHATNILFLPLAFPHHGMTHHTIVYTASPSKLPEYLAAARPILVYAPAYSYYARYARQEGFAMVVDQPDLEKLRQAILELKHNKALCQRLMTSARRIARRYHDAVKVSARLQHLLGVAEKSVI